MPYTRVYAEARLALILLRASEYTRFRIIEDLARYAHEWGKKVMLSYDHRGTLIADLYPIIVEFRGDAIELALICDYRADRRYAEAVNRIVNKYGFEPAYIEPRFHIVKR